MTPSERRLDLEARIARTLREFRELCEQNRFFVTGDKKVGCAEAASLLNMSAKNLARLRSEGNGPPCYSRGVRGAPVMYRLDDLAAWVESHRENPRDSLDTPDGSIDDRRHRDSP